MCTNSFCISIFCISLRLFLTNLTTTKHHIMFKFFVFTSFLVFFVHYSIEQNCSNPVNLLQITDLPILDTADSGFKSQNVLSLVIMATQVDNRTDAIITLNATSPNCNYPGPNWVKTIVNCTEIWNATIPWQIAYQECGLNRTETAQSITFDGWIDVFQQDILGTIRGTPITRNLSTNFEYKVVFPKTLSLQSTTQVFAPILVDAAIVSESYDATAMQGQLNLFSSVQWPFELVQPQVAINSTQLFPQSQTYHKIVPTTLLALKTGTSPFHFQTFAISQEPMLHLIKSFAILSIPVNVLCKVKTQQSFSPSFRKTFVE